MSALFAFFHHIAAFVFVAALAVELVAFGDTLSRHNMRRIIIADAIYAAAATIVLIIGFVRVYFYEKGAEYYFDSGPFIVKLVIFALVALLSFYPSVEILSWKKALKLGDVPTPREIKIQRIRTIIHIEMFGIVLLILNAALMARGIGSLG